MRTLSTVMAPLSHPEIMRWATETGFGNRIWPPVTAWLASSRLKNLAQLR